MMTWNLKRHFYAKLIAGGSLAFLLAGHAPYRQWTVYRAERLMIVASKSEKAAFPLAEMVANDLKRTIPQVKPEATRAPTLRHITRLILSQQIQVAVITTKQAQLMFQGKGEGSREGPVPLRVVAFLKESHLLVAHTAFGKDNTFLMLSGLFDGSGLNTLSLPYKCPSAALNRSKAIGIPLHLGAQAFFMNQSRVDHYKEH